MVPGKYNMTIYKGGTYSLTLTAVNSLGVPLNFKDTYDEFKLQIRPTWAKMPYTDAALMDFTVANGRIIVPEDGLSLSLNIDAADTELINFKDGKYGFELITHVDLTANPPIEVEVIDKFLYGLVTVIEEVIS